MIDAVVAHRVPCRAGVQPAHTNHGAVAPSASPPGHLAQIAAIVAKELRDSLRNRWFLLYALAFTLLTVALSYLSLRTTGLGSHAGFGRTTAGLINLVLLVVPLMSLSVGAGTLAGERERGSLEYLLSHPISRLELLLGKYLGSAAALLAALTLGFGASALVLARLGGTRQIAGFLMLVVATQVLALEMLSVGLLLSTLARRTSVAIGAAILVWFTLVFLGDLGLMGGTIAFSLPIQGLFRLALLNPAQVFKMAVLNSIHASLDVLGPVGLYASRTYGRHLVLIFAGTAAAWILFPAIVAGWLSTRRGEP